jgi:MFS family permease
LVGDITDWITDTARRPTRVLAWGLETDFYGSQLLIHKLVTGAITATITAVTAAIAAAVTAAIAAAVTAAIAAAVTAAIAAAVTAAIAATVTAAIAATIDTARRRRRRSIDLAAAATVIATAAPVIAATGAHRAKERGTEQRRSKEEAKCFGLGRNGGGSECESCSGHDGYPA